MYAFTRKVLAFYYRQYGSLHRSFYFTSGISPSTWTWIVERTRPPEQYLPPDRIILAQLENLIKRTPRPLSLLCIRYPLFPPLYPASLCSPFPLGPIIPLCMYTGDATITRLTIPDFSPRFDFFRISPRGLVIGTATVCTHTQVYGNASRNSIYMLCGRLYVRMFVMRCSHCRVDSISTNSGDLNAQRSTRGYPRRCVHIGNVPFLASFLRFFSFFFFSPHFSPSFFLSFIRSSNA